MGYFPATRVWRRDNRFIGGIDDITDLVTTVGFSVGGQTAGWLGRRLALRALKLTHPCTRCEMHALAICFVLRRYLGVTEAMWLGV